MENLGLRRVASLFERRHYFIRASGTGRPMTKAGQRACAPKTGINRFGLLFGFSRQSNVDAEFNPQVVRHGGLSFPSSASFRRA
jgi:hypothetical protein